MEQTKEINKTLRMVRTHLPAPGTELGIYTFLAPDALWIGTVDAQRPFVVVAEEYVGGENGTFLLIVLAHKPERRCHCFYIKSSRIQTPLPSYSTGSPRLQLQWDQSPQSAA